MFTVKATYRNETRKFVFPDSVLFPTFHELHLQLYRIFPLSHNYYLSSLVFSPDASKPGRILVGKEVHSAKDYDSHVALLRRLWPNPLLRFTVFDETPHKALSGAPQRLSLYSSSTIPPSEPISKLSSPVVPCRNITLPPYPQSFLSPPPPPPPPQPPFTCVVPLPPAPPPIRFSPSTESCSPHECGTAKTAPCCSVVQGKADIHVLLSSFKEDLERILCRTLGPGNVEPLPALNVRDSTCEVPRVDIIPRTEASLVSASANAASRWCFVCKASFSGVWYGCIKCPWHAVCPTCFSKSHSAHTLSFGPSHVVQQRSIDSSTQVSTRAVRANETLHSTSGTPQSPVPASPAPAGESAPLVHRDVICNSCNKSIAGVRHKCLDCPDYDLCTPCVESGATEQHNPFHEFFDIETPGRVYVHTVYSEDRDRSFGNRHQLSSSDHAPVTQQGNTPADLRHSATCNLCDSAIIGERYKCVVCPDFDTCSSCFRITTEQHPNHGFVKVNKPEDLMMRDSVLLRQVDHLAVCDSCHRTIRGARFKCMHPECPDFDLCSNCEALPIPVHPLNHPMLKMRTPDTVIPTVYRVGQTQAIDEPTCRESTSVCGESRSSILLPPPDPLATPTASPEMRPVVVSGQVTNMAPEHGTPFAEEFLSPLGSPASEVPETLLTSIPIAPSHLLVDVADPPGSPQSVHPVPDIYHQLWPRVNQEMMQLNAAQEEAEHPVVDPVEVAVSEPVSLEPLVAEGSLPESLTTSSIFPAVEHHGTCPVSPVPSTKSIVDGYRTPSSTPSDDQESRDTAPQFLADDQQQIAVTDAPHQSRHLDSVLVGDTNVPDGQIFPPGAEFVKGWHMMNNGGLPWPTTTEVQFVAGEMFTSGCSTALKAKVGVVHPGQDLDVWTGDLKAPDVPGRYVGYWRLSDGQGNFFGSSVWIDLTVADHHSDQASEQSLAASSMVMPSAHPTNSVDTGDEVQDPPQLSLPSTKTVTDDVEDPESDISSVSLVSVPTSDDEDAEWQDTRTHSEPLEYVVLYDSGSDE